ncbi:hypothetical protein [Ciceribacter thiooxidans]|uniref:Uncharacterized protein n=1 Tax=Ciceribacter thiooxidans TaxID=1969821 RepID=A0ABV7I2J8_9HYPH
MDETFAIKGLIALDAGSEAGMTVGLSLRRKLSQALAAVPGKTEKGHRPEPMPLRKR